MRRLALLFFVVCGPSFGAVITGGSIQASSSEGALQVSGDGLQLSGRFDLFFDVASITAILMRWCQPEAPTT